MRRRWATVGLGLALLVCLTLVGLPRTVWGQTPAQGQAQAEEDAPPNPAFARKVCEKAAKDLPESQMAECLQGMLYDFPTPRRTLKAYAQYPYYAAASTAEQRCMLEKVPERAVQICLRSLIVARADRDSEDHAYAFIYHSRTALAAAYLRLAQYPETERLYHEMLDAARQRFGDNSADAAGRNVVLADFYSQYLGDYEQALFLMQKAFAINPPKTPLEAYTNETRLIVLHAQNRRFDRAEAGARNLLIIADSFNEKWRTAEMKALTKTSVLGQIGQYLIAQGKHAEAKPYLEQTLTIMRQFPSLNNDDVQGGIHYMMGDNAAYINFWRKGLAKLNLEDPAGREAGHTYLRALIQALAYDGKMAEAQSLAVQQLQLAYKVYNKNDVIFIDALSFQAWLHGQADRVDDALRNWRQVITTEETWLHNESSEGTLTSMLAKMHRSEDGVYWLAQSHPQSEAALRLAMATALLRKGRVVEEGARINRALFSDAAQGDTAARYKLWQKTRGEREQLLLAGPGTSSVDAYLTQLQTLKLQSDQLEHALTQLVRERANQRFALPSLDEIVPRVAQRLPADSMLVEIALVTRPIDAKRGVAYEQIQEQFYLAFFLFPDQHIEVQMLGSVADIEAQIASLMNKLRDRTSDPIPAARALYQKLFGSVRRSFSRLFVSADGAFNVLPFATLHDGLRYLNERLPVHYLTSGRDLLREAAAPSTQPPLILADPDFATADLPQTSAAAQRYLDATTRGLYSALPSLARLPGTRQEAEQVAQLVGGRLLMDKEATEQALRNTASPRVLHLATHGMFYSEKLGEQTGIAGSRSSFYRSRAHATSVGQMPAAATGQGLGVGLRDALSLSAMLLAGAGLAARSAQADQDGILTADEVRGLDLRGTQLVVLSACDTGRGVIHSGQGVQGLSRAFLVAGAETLLVSLWPVADAETGALIQRYYQKLVRENRPRVTALQEAMLDLQKQHPHPYYWAPFIAIGRDAPLAVSAAKQRLN